MDCDWTCCTKNNGVITAGKQLYCTWNSFRDLTPFLTHTCTSPINLSASHWLFWLLIPKYPCYIPNITFQYKWEQIFDMVSVYCTCALFHCVCVTLFCCSWLTHIREVINIKPGQHIALQGDKSQRTCSEIQHVHYDYRHDGVTVLWEGVAPVKQRGCAGVDKRGSWQERREYRVGDNQKMYKCVCMRWWWRRQTHVITKLFHLWNNKKICWLITFPLLFHSLSSLLFPYSNSVLPGGRGALL